MLSEFAVHDCQAGSSRRRTDLLLRLCNPNLLFENDEEQHKDRTTNYECPKISGTLVDLGAPGLTKEEPGRCSPMNSISIWLVLAVP